MYENLNFCIENFKKLNNNINKMDVWIENMI